MLAGCRSSICRQRLGKHFDVLTDRCGVCFALRLDGFRDEVCRALYPYRERCVHELTGQTFATFRSSATRLDLFDGLAATREFGNDEIDRGSPNKRFRLFVPCAKELVGGGDEIINAEETITANALVGEFGESTFNQVQPAAAYGHLVDYKAAMFPQPGFDFGSAMRSVVVRDNV
jgi:hypothetical protein